MQFLTFSKLGPWHSGINSSSSLILPCSTSLWQPKMHTSKCLLQLRTSLISYKENFNKFKISKTVLRGKFIAASAYIKIEKKKNSNRQPNVIPKEMEKEPTKPKVSRRKIIIKIRTEVRKYRIENINEAKLVF